MEAQQLLHAELAPFNSSKSLLPLQLWQMQDTLVVAACKHHPYACYLLGSAAVLTLCAMVAGVVQAYIYRQLYMYTHLSHVCVLRAPIE